MSDVSGNFEFAGIPWGTYTLIVEKAGISTVDLPVISLNENNSNENNIIVSIRAEVITVSLNKLVAEINSAYLYPNPVIDKLSIAVISEKASNIVLIIHNSTGQKVYENKFTQKSGINKINVDVSDLSPGVYYVRILLHSDRYLSLKFVK